ncbi:MAG TPA: glycosyltransferase [Rhizomicrobium sp.]|nr:glycosyltransferase [Rhizomicrobium sp.]
MSIVAGRAATADGSIRILHVFPTFEVGGAQMRFVALASAMDGRFEHIVIPIDGRRGAAALLPARANVAVEDGPAGGSLPSRLLAYRRRIQALAPDILVTYNWGAIEWALANAVAGAPHIHIEDGFGPEEARRQIPRRVWARRLALRKSTVVVPSLTLRAMALRRWRLSERRLRYIPNGVAPRDGAPNPGVRPEDGARIVWAGAMRREKNLPRLLRSFATIEERATLLLIGDGPERAAAESEAARLSLGERARFLGFRSDAREMIEQCDIFVLSSDTEQMPLVVLEAMDAGLAVASVDVGDIANMVADENRPFITPVSEQDLAQALRGLAANPELRSAIGEKNRAKVRAQFRLDRMIATYEELFLGAARAGTKKS